MKNSKIDEINYNTILQDMVKCSVCNDYLWFSPDGYLTCNCDGLPFKDIEPAIILKKITSDLKENLKESGFLKQITEATNNNLKKGSTQFSETEIEKIITKTLDNAISSENPKILKQTLLLFFDEIILKPDGTLEMYLIPAE